MIAVGRSAEVITREVASSPKGAAYGAVLDYGAHIRGGLTKFAKCPGGFPPGSKLSSSRQQGNPAMPERHKITGRRLYAVSVVADHRSPAKILRGYPCLRPQMALRVLAVRPAWGHGSRPNVKAGAHQRLVAESSGCTPASRSGFPSEFVIESV